MEKLEKIIELNILLQIVHAVLLRKDCLIQKRNKKSFLVQFVFAAHGRLTIVKKCGLAPCSDR